MGMSRRIDECVYEDAAKRHVKAERRTISGQIEYWASAQGAVPPRRMDRV